VSRPSTGGRSSSRASLVGTASSDRCHENSKMETGRRRPHARSPYPPGDRTKKALKPRARCTLADWAAETTYRLSQRGRRGSSPGASGRLRYQSIRGHQDALRQRLRELRRCACASVSTPGGVVEARGWRVNANGFTDCMTMRDGRAHKTEEEAPLARCRCRYRHSPMALEHGLRQRPARRRPWFRT